MIFTTKPLKVSLADVSDPVEFFLSHSEPIDSCESRKVVFARYIGMEKEDEAYIALIRKIDEQYRGAKSRAPYLRADRFPAVVDPPKLDALARQYDAWREAALTARGEALFRFAFPFKMPTDTLEWTQKMAFQKVSRVYASGAAFAGASMARNFGIKMFGWMQLYLPRLFAADARKTDFPKIVFIGKIKRQELLFLYFLSLLGCDILYMNCVEDIDPEYAEAFSFSTAHICKNKRKTALQIPEPTELGAPSNAPGADCRGPSRVNLTRTEKRVLPPAASFKEELSYEELAARSASVVMIKVCDEKGKYFKSGSGVVINRRGYILTNFHVVCGGEGYAVQFENEAREYKTQSLVKYHTDYDLAVIKVEKCSDPIVLYGGDALVRGRKVVAIGSPLGLFNTVSDGIISGFRNVEKKSMIQFTAPISNGSSGGALLDMRGSLVGLITAGYDDGQNLNLAVDYVTIREFIRGFI